MGRVVERPYWVLIFSVFVRAVHQVGAGVFLSAFLFPDQLPLPTLYLLIASVSGVILVWTEAMRHRQMLRELAGISTVIKLILLGMAYHHMAAPGPLVLIAFLLASVGSHAPKVIRHRLLF